VTRRNPFLLPPLQFREWPALRALLPDSEIGPAMPGLPSIDQCPDHNVKTMLELSPGHGCVRTLSAAGAVLWFAAVVEGFLAYGARADAPVRSRHPANLAMVNSMGGIAVERLRSATKLRIGPPA